MFPYSPFHIKKVTKQVKGNNSHNLFEIPDTYIQSEFFGNFRYISVQNIYAFSLSIGAFTSLRRHRASAEDLKKLGWRKINEVQSLNCGLATGVLANAEGSDPTMYAESARVRA
jgi:hypothetical protein